MTQRVKFVNHISSQYDFFKLGGTRHKAKKDKELQEKGKEKDKKHIEKMIRKNPKITATH